MSDDGWEDNADDWGEEGAQAAGVGVIETDEVEESDDDSGEEPQEQEGGGRGVEDDNCRNCRQVS